MTSQRDRSGLTRREVLAGAAGVAGASLLAACAPQTTTPTPSGSGARGGQIVFASSTEPLTMNPNVGIISASNTYFSPVIFDSMARPGDDMSPIPSLAESWTISPDGLTYTFNLRKGVKFHDGAPFTAADVKYTLDVINDKTNTGTLKLSYTAVKGAPAFQAATATELTGVTTPDDFTVRIELTRADASFLQTVGFAYILPKHIYSKVPVADMEKHASARQPIGTGPFKLVEWRSNETFVTDAFDDYWGGRPKLDRFVFRIVPDLTTLPSLIRTGGVDAMGLFNSVSATDYDAFSKDPNIRLYNMTGYTHWVIYFNNADPALADPRVRRALIHATDRESILKNVLLGQGKILNDPIHPLNWAHTEPAAKYGYDPERAKALLREVGYTAGPDGILTKDGKRLTVTLSTFMQSTTYPEVVQAQWKAVGVDMQIDRTDFAAFFGPKYQARRFQTAGSHTSAAVFPDPAGVFARFVSARSPSNYKNEAVDGFIARALTTTNRDERKRLYASATDLILQDAAEIQLVMPNENWASTSKVKLPTKPGSVVMMHNLKDWERVG
jgi:peptide/nickel transport system substrate-binding protein